MLPCRAVVRQLSRPSLLVATYKGDSAGIATAAIEELEKPLATCVQELARLPLTTGGVRASDADL